MRGMKHYYRCYDLRKGKLIGEGIEEKNIFLRKSPDSMSNINEEDCIKNTENTNLLLLQRLAIYTCRRF